MNDGNFKVRCISFSNIEFSYNKIYEVFNGRIKGECFIHSSYYSIDELNNSPSIRSQFELVEEGGKNMSKWNGKIRCINPMGCVFYTKDKAYDVKNGQFTTDDGCRSEEYESFEHLYEDSVAKWEEIKEDLREMLKPCMVVKCRDGILRMLIQCEDGIVLKQLNTVEYIKLSDYYNDLLINKQRNQHLDIIEVYGYSNNKSTSLELRTNYRELLWKREEKSKTQIEIEEIETEQRKLADRLAKLRKEM